MKKREYFKNVTANKPLLDLLPALLSKYYSVHQIEKYEMGRACGTYRRRKFT